MQSIFEASATQPEQKKTSLSPKRGFERGLLCLCLLGCGINSPAPDNDLQSSPDLSRCSNEIQKVIQNTVRQIAEGRSLYFFLDHDGTLARSPNDKIPSIADPTSEENQWVIPTLASLASLPNTQVHVITGKPSEEAARFYNVDSADKLFRDAVMKINLHTEFGMSSRWAGETEFQNRFTIPQDELAAVHAVTLEICNDINSRAEGLFHPSDWMTFGEKDKCYWANTNVSGHAIYRSLKEQGKERLNGTADVLNQIFIDEVKSISKRVGQKKISKNFFFTHEPSNGVIDFVHKDALKSEMVWHILTGKTKAEAKEDGNLDPSVVRRLNNTIAISAGDSNADELLWTAVEEIKLSFAEELESLGFRVVRAKDGGFDSPETTSTHQLKEIQGVKDLLIGLQEATR